MAAHRKLDHVDESGVDRSYYHGTIDRDEAVGRLKKANKDGTFLLRMSATQANVYTLSVQAGGEIKHIRVNNLEDGTYSLGKSKETFKTIWELVESQLDRNLKSTKTHEEVQLLYPLPSGSEAIAPDLLAGAAEAGMGADSFDQDVMAFMTGGVSTEELVRRRQQQAKK